MRRRYAQLGILIWLMVTALFTGTIPAVGESGRPDLGSTADFVSPARDRINVSAMMQALQDQERIRVIVQLDTSFVPEGKITRNSVGEQRNEIVRSQEHVAAAVRASNSAEIHRFATVPFVVFEVDAAGLEALMNDPQVRGIQEDRIVPPLLQELNPVIGADDVWAEGVQGTGQVVAVLDTGVDTDHTFLAGKTVSEACYSTTYALYGSTSLCPAGDNPTGADFQVGTGAGVNCALTIDGCAHGTHVAGIAVGSGDPLFGVAPDADLISIQVFSRFEGELCTGSGSSSPCAMSYTSDQIRALERIYELRETYSIAAVNMSLGGDTYTDQAACDTDEAGIKTIIDQLRSVGIPVVIAAGNNGSRTGISAPGCVSSAVSVGSVELSDTVASYSNTATFLDFYAPGSAVYSSYPNDLYGNSSGTSMAAPVVAGAFALLKQGAPGETLDGMIFALDDTGVPVNDTRTGGSVTGIPRIQVDEAYYSLQPSVFDDVPVNHWAVDYIEALYDAGYISGCSTDPLLYCPDRSMTRGEGAVFVERGIHEQAGYIPAQPGTTVFTDVDLGEWYAKWAQALWDDSYTDGCNTDPLMFCPVTGHTRAEGAVFYLRMLETPDYRPADPTSTVFADVDLGQWYAKWVEEAYARGLFLPCQTEPELLACPLDPLLRDVAAYMMVKAKGGLPLSPP